jgi:hypothetical protein
VPAHASGPAMNSGRTSAHPAQCPAQQRMGRRQRQHPGRRIPAGLDEEPRIQQAGQARGPAGQRHPGECVIGPDRVRGHCRRGRRAGHRVTPTCWRGLGAKSTAARSRAGSGCRYTCAEDTEA